MEIFMICALPDAWANGSIKGICTREGFEISMEWKNKTLRKVTVLPGKADYETNKWRIAKRNKCEKRTGNQDFLENMKFATNTDNS